MNIISDKVKEDNLAFETANKFVTFTVNELTRTVRDELFLDILVKNGLTTKEEFAKLTQESMVSELINLKEELNKNKIIIPTNEHQIMEQKVQKMSIDIITEVIIGMENLMK